MIENSASSLWNSIHTASEANYVLHLVVSDGDIRADQANNSLGVAQFTATFSDTAEADKLKLGA